MDPFYTQDTRTQDEKVASKIKNDSNNFIINAYTNIIIGFIFAPFSRGLSLYFTFVLFFEAKYAFDIKCKYDDEIVARKIILFILGFGAFIIGRRFLVNDKNPFRSKYDKAPSISEIWFCILNCEDPPKEYLDGTI